MEAMCSGAPVIAVNSGEDTCKLDMLKLEGFFFMYGFALCLSEIRLGLGLGLAILSPRAGVSLD